MAQKLRPEFHISLAQQFVKDIQLLKNNTYSFLGKVSEWNGTDTPPTTIADTFQTDLDTRDNVIYMSRVMPNDVSLCAKRYDWNTGTIYDRWDSTVDMSDSNFYVVTSNYAVYKCLDNNGGAASTIEPTGNGGYVAFKLADGYVWKYMYTIPAFKRFKFMNPDYIPVQRSVTDSFYNNGSIEDVVINLGGSGYTTVAQTTITIGGPGTGAILVPVITEAGNIIEVKVINGGSGFTTAPTLTVVGAGTKLYPESTGSSAIIEAIVSAGEIKSVIVKDPGVSYSQNTATSIVVTGDGQDALLTPVVYNGAIIDVVVENGGSNYSYANITVSGTGTGASITASLGVGDIVSDQTVVEQLTTPGAIYSIKVTNPGSLYTLGSSPTVTITGDGTGASAIAILDGDEVKDIQMVTYGSGYTWANVAIAPSPTISGVDATAEIIKAPYNGHGFDAPNELFGDVICISSVLSADTILSEMTQDYRQYGVIKNPRKIGSEEFATVGKELLCYKVRMLSTTGLEADMVLNLNGVKYIVVKFDASYAYLQPLHSREDIPLGTLADNASSLKFTVSEIISSPTINKYSGQLMLLSTENPFTFTSEQSIALKTYIKC